MKLFLSIFLSVLFGSKLQAAALYHKDGIILSHILIQEKKVNVPSLNEDVIIWKSTFELMNNSNKSIAIRIPCYLYYAYAYLNPMEISIVQKYVSDYKLSSIYKNYVVEKPQMLAAKKSIISEKYFATLDNVDLNSAIMNWNFQFSFWH
ncbi:MAG: hypothetical protein R2739_06785 [Chitinophagales bacterium]|nr:hypothetical protein [Bacteroidota bacterium]